MSKFFLQLLGKSVEKGLAEAPDKNPLDAVLANPMIKQMARSYRKEIIEGLTNGEQDLIKLIEGIELQPGEDQAAPIIDIDVDAEGRKEIRFLVGAFSGLNLTRVITDIPLRQFLIDWYNQKLK